MRYTEADRESTNVEDRRGPATETFGAWLSRSVSDYFNPKAPNTPSASQSPFDTPTQGNVAPQLDLPEVQLPQQSLDIGQDWLDELVGKPNNRSRAEQVKENTKCENQASDSDESKLNRPSESDNAQPREKSAPSASETTPAPSKSSTESITKPAAEPEFLDVSSPY